MNTRNAAKDLRLLLEYLVRWIMIMVWFIDGLHSMIFIRALPLERNAILRGAKCRLGKDGLFTIYSIFMLVPSFFRAIFYKRRDLLLHQLLWHPRWATCCGLRWPAARIHPTRWVVQIWTEVRYVKKSYLHRSTIHHFSMVSFYTFSAKIII